MTSFCPNCGTKRLGALRYCRSCGFDYETGEVLTRPAAAPGAAPRARAVVQRAVPGDDRGATR